MSITRPACLRLPRMGIYHRGFSDPITGISQDISRFFTGHYRRYSAEKILRAQMFLNDMTVYMNTTMPTLPVWVSPIVSGCFILCPVSLIRISHGLRSDDHQTHPRPFPIFGKGYHRFVTELTRHRNNERSPASAVTFFDGDRWLCSSTVLSFCAWSYVRTAQGTSGFILRGIVLVYLIFYAP